MPLLPFLRACTTAVRDGVHGYRVVLPDGADLGNRWDERLLEAGQQAINTLRGRRLSTHISH
jgi:hypothetical protein